jgi:signal peptidase
LKPGAEVRKVMTADEGPPSSSSSDGSGDGTPSTPPSTGPDERPDPDSSGDATSHADGPTRETDEALAETDDGAEPVSPEESTPSTGTDDRADLGERRAPDPVPGGDADRSLLHRMWHARSGPLFFVREVATSAGAVALVGLLLFGVSGVWPPMVAVESGSMEPHMHKGDLVFITEPGRYTPDEAYGSTGVVTAETGDDIGYRTFGGPGSVVVYDDPGRGGPPIIHRALFYVEEGENWYGRTDPEFVSADSCTELLNCPAPHAGFITKGDANSRYDQASNIAAPVKPSWVTGIARIRIPYLGWVRLGLADVVQPPPTGVAAVDGETDGDARLRSIEERSRPLQRNPGLAQPV